MPRFVDRTGQRFGRLSVVRRAGTGRFSKVLWECLCDCGKTTTVVAGDLVTGNTTSCGCIVPNFKHGGWYKSSYNTWRAMMRRCTNTKDKDYPRYGGKGITVYAKWHDYSVFAADMGEPVGDETLDRIDPYGSYTPENCRWAGVKTQNRNIRVRADSKTGVNGVSITLHGTYMAHIVADKRAYYTKCFKTLEEAAAARKALERLHWGVA